METVITHLDEPGPHNTQAVISAVKRRLAQGGIRTVVVASESGQTAAAIAEGLLGIDAEIVCVSAYAGREYGEGRSWPALGDAMRSTLGDLGVRIVDQTPWIFGCTFDTAFLSETAPATIVHKFLSRTLGFGFKTCLEVALIAAEAGAVPPGAEVIAVAGTGWLGGGADTALVVRPATVYGGAFLKNEGGLEVREILAMPRIKFSERLIQVMKKAGKDEPL